LYIDFGYQNEVYRQLSDDLVHLQAENAQKNLSFKIWGQITF
jgi:hypothetical protein